MHEQHACDIAGEDAVTAGEACAGLDQDETRDAPQVPRFDTRRLLREALMCVLVIAAALLATMRP